MFVSKLSVRAALGLALACPLALAQDVTVPGDVATIQAAIDLVGPGGSVFVDPGTYVETLVIDPTGQWGSVRGQDALRIEATGPGVVLTWPSKSSRSPNNLIVDSDGMRIDPLLGVKAASAVELVGLVFDGNDDAKTANAAGLFDLSVGIFADGGGLDVEDCEFSRFRGAELLDGVGSGVLADRTASVVIDDCEFTTLGVQAVRLQSGSNGSIDRSRFIGEGLGGLDSFVGIRVRGGSVATSDDCLFSGLDNRGLVIFGSTTGAMEVSESVGGNRLVDASVSDCGFALQRTSTSADGGPADELLNCIITNTIDPPIFVFMSSPAVEFSGSAGAPWRVEDCTFANLIGPGLEALTGGGTITGNSFNFNDGFGSDQNAVDNAGGNNWDGNQWSDFASNSLAGMGQYLVPGSAGAIDGAPNSDAALAQNYGSGCPGEGGLVPQISVTGPPVLGQASYPILLSDAKPAAPAALGYSLSQALLPVGGGCSLYLGGNIGILQLVTDPMGGASIDLGTPPAGLGFEGLDLYFQYFVFDPASPYAGMFSATDGLRLQLGL